MKKSTAIGLLLLAFGIAGGIDQVPQLQQENEALRERLAQMQQVATGCDNAAHIAAHQTIAMGEWK